MNQIQLTKNRRIKLLETDVTYDNKDTKLNYICDDHLVVETR